MTELLLCPDLDKLFQNWLIFLKVVIFSGWYFFIHIFLVVCIFLHFLSFILYSFFRVVIIKSNWKSHVREMISKWLANGDLTSFISPLIINWFKCSVLSFDVVRRYFKRYKVSDIFILLDSWTSHTAELFTDNMGQFILFGSSLENNRHFILLEISPDAI